VLALFTGKPRHRFETSAPVMVQPQPAIGD
jgi:hypothetical protein